MWGERKVATTESALAPVARPNVTCGVVVITCNEAHLLDECLQSVARWADEITIVDMHSTDGTQEVARRYTSRIYVTERLPYADPARNYAMSLPTTDWILMLDADERLPMPLAQELRRIAREDHTDVVQIPWHGVMFGKVVTAPGLADGVHARFFRRGAVEWPPEVHGAPDLSGVRVLTLLDDRGTEYVMWHDTWRSVPQVVDKLMRYVPSEVEKLRADGRHFSARAMVKAGVGEFYRIFVWGKAYQDGISGLLSALYFMFYQFTIWASLWEAEGRTRADDPWISRQGKRLRGPLVFLARAGKLVRGK